MKNLLILFFATLLLVSCEKTETNSPAFQASIEDDFFKANFAGANYIENGAYFVLQGKNSNQIITLRGSYPPEGVNLIFGEGSENFAIYEDINGIVYSTSIPGGEGSMKINEISTEEKHMTGEFSFTGISISLDTLSINSGVFYQVPYGNEIGDGSNAGSFSAELNGSVFLPLDVFANDNGNAILIKGVINSEEILIGVPNDVETGTYNAVTGGVTARVNNDSGNEDAISGEVTIATHDIIEKTISGTFQFQTPTNTVNIGQFNVTYQ
ncbi:MAG: hypothetical protein ACI93P_000925 [bacterium]|jgi:hypothetical protein